MMRDDRLLKKVLFGKTDGKNKTERPQRRWTDRRPDGLEQERYLQLVQNGGRQNQVEPTCEICHGHWTPMGCEPVEVKERRRRKNNVQYFTYNINFLWIACDTYYYYYLHYFYYMFYLIPLLNILCAVGNN